MLEDKFIMRIGSLYTQGLNTREEIQRKTRVGGFQKCEKVFKTYLICLFSQCRGPSHIGCMSLLLYFVNSSLYSICYLLLTLYYSSSTITNYHCSNGQQKFYCYLSAGVEVWVGLQPGAITPKTMVLSRLHQTSNMLSQ